VSFFGGGQSVLGTGADQTIIFQDELGERKRARIENSFNRPAETLVGIAASG